MTAAPPSKVALVTGASRGLGAVVARTLAGAGYALVVGARGAEELHEAAERFRTYSGVVTEVVGDVSVASTRTALGDAVGSLGRLDVLVNNASELGPGGRPPILSVDPAEWEHAYRVNVVSPVALVAALRPWLVRTTAPLVVNITSDAAVGAYPGWAPYGATKAALELVSRTLSAELKDEGVSVVVVDPGDLRTAMHQAAFLGEDIGDRPLPEVTVPFWTWLLGQEPGALNGQRYQAQSERWGIPA